MSQVPHSGAAHHDAAPAVTNDPQPRPEASPTPPAQESRAAEPASKKKHVIRIEHKVPGRVRMRIPGAKHNPAYLEMFQNVFMSIPGITKVKAKHDTGSIVIHYDLKREREFQAHFHHYCAQNDMSVHAALPGDEIGEIAKKIEAEAEFLAERSHTVRVAVDTIRKLDYQIKSLSGNTIDLKIVLVAGLAVVTFAEIGAEAATPMWVTLALFAANHFVELKHEGHAAPAAAPMSSAAR
ncbi:hypothetical protein F3J20_25300 [Paraburkholderia sp. Cy-641]|uniref:HMA2 domain-containing protein n=1 Tax=Paraburkholderia sp. Cy-641 TaxID=2608337 RepID=UPI0014228BB9|nr:hypothetical protein [Paraburkholderia sp. Cy-641]NIF80663.1 hypothetical protein [Paraburkholderia sp. Cy-641]